MRIADSSISINGPALSGETGWAKGLHTSLKGKKSGEIRIRLRFDLFGGRGGSWTRLDPARARKTGNQLLTIQTH